MENLHSAHVFSPPYYSDTECTLVIKASFQSTHFHRLLVASFPKYLPTFRWGRRTTLALKKKVSKFGKSDHVSLNILPHLMRIFAIIEEDSPTTTLEYGRGLDDPVCKIIDTAQKLARLRATVLKSTNVLILATD